MPSFGGDLVVFLPDLAKMQARGAGAGAGAGADCGSCDCQPGLIFNTLVAMVNNTYDKIEKEARP